MSHVILISVSTKGVNKVACKHCQVIYLRKAIHCL